MSGWGWISVNMMNGPIRKGCMAAEEKEHRVIDPKRAGNRRQQGRLGVVGLALTAVILGALMVCTGSIVMAQDSSSELAQAAASAAAPVLKIDTGDTAWVLSGTTTLWRTTQTENRGSSPGLGNKAPETMPTAFSNSIPERVIWRP